MECTCSEDRNGGDPANHTASCEWANAQPVVLRCKDCGWQEATSDGYCLECAAPETFEDTMGCDMCGAHIDDPCDCFDPQGDRRYRNVAGA